MSERRAPPPDTVNRQRLASSPRHSAWVSANAGSGKTEVLVQRVIRLLLDGARPDSILCLTFTKAAAAEMMNRLFRRLGEWITLPQPDLRARIADITGEACTEAIEARARKLFAQALETPGGLKVQTIHAFCERLLQLFPFDANVPARFTVLDEAESRRLVQQSIIEQIAVMESSDDGSAMMALLAADTSLDMLAALVQESLKDKDIFLGPARADGHDLAAFGIDPPPHPDAARLAFGQHAFWRSAAKELIGVLRAKTGPTAAANAQRIEAALKAAPVQRHALCRDLVLTGKDKRRELKTIFAKPITVAYPESCALFEDMAAAFEAADDAINTHAAIERSAAMRHFISGVLRRYAARRAERGALNFDDLIGKTRHLLTRPDIAPWILYKLDYGLAHILVDEAQDTSPVQWSIIDNLSREFTAGDSAVEQLRTIFAVGDEKQSIYGFQGAQPRAFGEMRRLLETRHTAVGRRVEPVELILSFRSAPEVLSAVDATFAFGNNAQGLSFDGGAGIPRHEALHADRPGFVELWPQMKGVSAPEADDVWAPDAEDGQSIAPIKELTDRIARQIRHWMAHGDPNGRPVRPGDIMILVRQRGPLFEEIIKALKFAGIDVAGADRLKLNAHIAVRDLLALGRACLMPRDDLTLAAMLKSPFFNFDDEDLLAFAPRRSGSLMEAWIAYAASAPKAAEALRRFDLWRAKSRQSGPFMFYAYVLEASGGRKALLQRLGGEARDAINEFLQRAQAFEIGNAASLCAFLMDFESADIEIKRDFAQDLNEVRVMTVHAAKGLEAPIVILPDTMSKPDARKNRQLVMLRSARGDILPVWSPSSRGQPRCLDAARAEEAVERDNEYRRQLYVAMTRAQNGLLICGAGKDKAKDNVWHSMVQAALVARITPDGGECVELPGFDEKPVKRWMLPARPREPAPVEKQAAVAVLDRSLPDWLFSDAPSVAANDAPLAPSSLIDAADRDERAGDTPRAIAARARGRVTHAMLEQLPAVAAAERWTHARRIAGRMGLAEAQAQRLYRAVQAVIARPDLAPLFGPGSRAEVAVAGRVPREGGADLRVAGVIDRLAITDEAVWIADYKTGRFPPADAGQTPEAIIGQLALYRAVVTGLAPGRPVRCLVIWTAGPEVHEIAPDALDAALSRVTGGR